MHRLFVLFASVALGPLFQICLFAEEAPKATAQFIEVVEKNFSKWDKDKNGDISLEELNLLVVNPEIKGAEAAAVAALRRAAKKKDYIPPKFTLDEIKNLATLKPIPADKPNLYSMFNAASNKLAKLNRELFPKGKPGLTELNQGKLGDCFCLAPLGALCYRDPLEVVNMIKKLPDGNYEVKLGAETIPVSPPTDTEIALSSSTDNDGIWVNVYEKAIGVYRLRELTEKDRPVTGLDLISKGGSAGTMLGVVTGHKIDRFSLAIFKNDKGTAEERETKLKALRTKLVKGFEEKRLVTTGTNATITPATPNINTNHAYAVLGYDQASDKLRVWNPHGQKFTPKGAPGLEFGYPTADGIFQIPLRDFAQLFAGITFELPTQK